MWTIILIILAVYLLTGAVICLFLYYLEYLDGIDLILQDILPVAFCFTAWPFVLIVFGLAAFNNHAAKVLVKGKSKNEVSSKNRS